LGAFLFLAACSNAKGEFVNGRILQTCNQEWPACNVVAGCLLGNLSYTQGQFPGDSRVIVNLDQASTVTLEFYLDQVESVGNAMQMTWFEGGCRERIDVNLTGQEFVQEGEQLGVITRQNQLEDVGDHLIEFSSDSQLEYFFKVTVTPLRNSVP
jgi:hypothetical protein